MTSSDLPDDPDGLAEELARVDHRIVQLKLMLRGGGFEHGKTWADHHEELELQQLRRHELVQRRPVRREDVNPAETSTDYTDAAQRAVALVLLAERGDHDAFAASLAQVADPEAAGALVYGLVQLTRTALGQPPVPPDARIEVLEGLAVDCARGPSA